MSELDKETQLVLEAVRVVLAEKISSRVHEISKGLGVTQSLDKEISVITDQCIKIIQAFLKKEEEKQKELDWQNLQIFHHY